MSQRLVQEPLKHHEFETEYQNKETTTPDTVQCYHPTTQQYKHNKQPAYETETRQCKGMHILLITS
uniref:Uncharacterized protein n=1 Tax=Arundo donax TaxID=35708 RepID=A0A0A9BKD8_ARUDO